MTTQNFDLNASLIERSISAGLSNIKDQIDSEGTTIWTFTVKKILTELGKSPHNNFLVASSSGIYPADCGEWLYDLVWYENNVSPIGLKSLHLVVESEWKNPRGNVDYLQDIQDDFEKLIVARSPHKLMIFESDSINITETYISWLNNTVINCDISQPKDRYMYAGWNIKEQTFLFDLYIH